MFKFLGAMITPPFSIFIVVLSVVAALLILFLAFLGWLLLLVTGEDGPMGLSEDNIFKGPYLPGSTKIVDLIRETGAAEFKSEDPSSSVTGTTSYQVIN